jgi:hypothetical protein
MKQKLGLAALALAIALVIGAAPQAATAAEPGAEVIAGLVTAIDRDRNRVTVRSSDGESHEFEAAPETLKDLEVGDRLEVKRRPETN